MHRLLPLVSPHHRSQAVPCVGGRQLAVRTAHKVGETSERPMDRPCELHSRRRPGGHDEGPGGAAEGGTVMVEPGCELVLEPWVFGEEAPLQGLELTSSTTVPSVGNERVRVRPARPEPRPSRSLQSLSASPRPMRGEPREQLAKLGHTPRSPHRGRQLRRREGRGWREWPGRPKSMTGCSAINSIRCCTAYTPCSPIAMCALHPDPAPTSHDATGSDQKQACSPRQEPRPQPSPRLPSTAYRPPTSSASPPKVESTLPQGNMPLRPTHQRCCKIRLPKKRCGI